MKIFELPRLSVFKLNDNEYTFFKCDGMYAQVKRKDCNEIEFILCYTDVEKINTDTTEHSERK